MVRIGVAHHGPGVRRSRRRHSCSRLLRRVAADSRAEPERESFGSRRCYVDQPEPGTLGGPPGSGVLRLDEHPQWGEAVVAGEAPYEDQRPRGVSLPAVRLIDLVTTVADDIDDGGIAGEAEMDSTDPAAVAASMDREAALRRPGEEARLGGPRVLFTGPEYAQQSQLEDIVAERLRGGSRVGERAVGYHVLMVEAVPRREARPATAMVRPRSARRSAARSSPSAAGTS